jgi:1-deoxy-D-xylulose-5-phosphate reductoisomerase
MKPKRKLAILGSTGSIGTQALDVVRRQPEHFSVSVLTGNNNWELLVEQAIEFSPPCVVVANEAYYAEVASRLDHLPIQVEAGDDALSHCVERDDIDMVLTAMVGFSGLQSTLNAIRHKKQIALANKETLVVAGAIITQLARKMGVSIIPVDSEHSALFQCIVGETGNPVEKIYLTASGGPFRGFSLEQLGKVTRAQALRHPNWEMGAKITIDSASMMNKGLEVIEARWLFDLDADQIDVIVHPQSILHSIVQFEDGSMKAQMGLPDMRLPIQYAIAHPRRLVNDLPRFDFLQYPSLTFEPVDTSVFHNLALAYRAMDMGGNAACILNAANEVTNRLFLEERIRFTDIANLNEAALENVRFIADPGLSDLVDSDANAREWVSAHYVSAR